MLHNLGVQRTSCLQTHFFPKTQTKQRTKAQNNIQNSCSIFICPLEAKAAEWVVVWFWAFSWSLCVLLELLITAQLPGPARSLTCSGQHICQVDPRVRQHVSPSPQFKSPSPNFCMLLKGLAPLANPVLLPGQTDRTAPPPAARLSH